MEIPPGSYNGFLPKASRRLAIHLVRSLLGNTAPFNRESHSSNLVRIFKVLGNMDLLYGIQDSEHKGPKRWTILGLH